MTWVRSTNELFDYDALQLNRKTLNVCGNCTLIRHKNEVSVLMEPLSSINKEIELLAYIQLQNGTILPKCR